MKISAYDNTPGWEGIWDSDATYTITAIYPDEWEEIIWEDVDLGGEMSWERINNIDIGVKSHWHDSGTDTFYCTQAWLEVEYGHEPNQTAVYVDDDFTESTPGWGNYSFDNIVSAWENLRSGGTMFIWGGTYALEDNGNGFGLEITRGPVSFVGNNSSTVSIIAESDYLLMFYIDSGTAENIICNFSNITFIGDADTYAIYYVGGKDSKIFNCIFDGFWSGIEFELSFENLVYNCTFQNFTPDSYDSVIYYGFCIRISFGEYIDDVTEYGNNDILNCLFNNNNASGIIIYASQFNKIIGNIFNNSAPYEEYGQEYQGYNLSHAITVKDCDGGSIAANNSIYLNDFYNSTNNEHCRDDNVVNGTFWDNGIKGNYYDNFDEDEEGAWDNDSNGIVDYPYQIFGDADAQDNYPLRLPSMGEIPPFFSGEIPMNGASNIPIALTSVSVNVAVSSGTFDWRIGGENITASSGTGETSGVKQANVNGPLAYSTGYTWWANASNEAGYSNQSFTFITEIYHGTIVYVDDDFNPSTPGWLAGKYDNINDALSAVNEGGIVYIYAGQYDEVLTITKTMSLTGIAGTYYQNHNQIILNCSSSEDGIIVQADYVNISGFAILNPKIGIYMDEDSDNCTITGMIIDNSSEECIFLYLSADNTLSKNNFTVYEPRDYYAIDFQDVRSARNKIYNNNFLESCGSHDLVGAYTIWNETYPIGGNYWSTYEDAEDDYQGAGQNVSGSDGIADDPYGIAGGSGSDYYPLMSPYTFENHAPYVYDPYPGDGATGVSISNPNLRITIQDPDGDAIEWTMQCVYIASVHLTGQSGGTKTVPMTSTMPYFMVITWYVNASDGNEWTNTAHTFTTESKNPEILRDDVSIPYPPPYTIQNAIDSAIDGDTIFVYRGHFEENLVIDKPLLIVGENMNETTIDGGNVAGDAVSIISDDVVMRNLTITRCGANADDAGIDANNVDSIVLQHNNVRNNRRVGIKLNDVMNSNISNNLIHDNTLDGLKMMDSDSNMVFNNIIYSNAGEDGMHVHFCDNNRFSNNTIRNNGDHGMESSNCNSNKYDNNTIVGNTNRGIWLEYDDSSIISDNTMKLNLGGGITLFNTQQLVMFTGSIAVYNNVIGSNEGTGIDLWGADACAVYRNNISGNGPLAIGGIRLYWGADNNSIFENEIIGYDFEAGLPNIQPVGIFLQGGLVPGFPELTVKNNEIFHNNFYGNLVQVNDDGDAIYNRWNDSYPSGGNYFDDFDEESEGAYDKYQGPGQDVLGADGIVDGGSPNPYNIPGTAGSQDHYPLKNPYGVVLQADFIYSPRLPMIDQKITFTDVSTGFVVVREWAFGDGSTGNGKTVFHMYDEGGFYTVTLRVTDRDGNTDMVSKTVTVGSDLVSIPPLKPPKYPNNPFTVPEMYELLRATMKSDEKVTIVVIDSGTVKRTYDSVDLTPISVMSHPKYSDGVDRFGHGVWVNYAVRYGIQTYCPNAVQISIRAFDEKGACSPATFLESLEMAKSLNPDIVTISAGIFGTADDEFSKKVGELRSAGIFVTVSAGNEGPTISSIMSPASGADSVAVGATDPIQVNGVKTILDLSDDVVCDFSSRGPVEGISPKPDFTSPGESIIGPWLSGDKVASGTSMSTPLLASVALQVIAVNKPLLNTVRFIYGNKVYLNIVESSLVYSAYDKGSPNDYGWGIPNAELASFFAWIQAVYALVVFCVVTVSILIVITALLRSIRKKERYNHRLSLGV